MSTHSEFLATLEFPPLLQRIRIKRVHEMNDLNEVSVSHREATVAGTFRGSF